MRQIDLTSIRAFARTLEGKPLVTQVRGHGFRLEVTRGGFIYTPESTGKARPEQDKIIERVLARYSETKSLRPGDYQDLTVNASYLLAIVARYEHLDQ